MGLLDYANSQPASKRGSSKKQKISSTEERFWEAKQKKVSKFSKALDVAHLVRGEKERESIKLSIFQEQLAKKKAPVTQHTQFGPFHISTLENGLKDIHIPLGISGRVYDNSYRDYLIK